MEADPLKRLINAIFRPDDVLTIIDDQDIGPIHTLPPIEVRRGDGNDTISVTQVGDVDDSQLGTDCIIISRYQAAKILPVIQAWLREAN